MKRWEFFLPCVVRSGNKRSRTKWRRLAEQDDATKATLAACFNVVVPKDALVSKPHPTRQIAVLAVLPRLFDDDNLAAGLKPVLDVLKCVREKKWLVAVGAPQLAWTGVCWDDSRKYARFSFDQKTVLEMGAGAVPGVLVTVQGEPE